VELGSRVGKFRGIKKLRKFARKNLTTEEINKLLLPPDKKGRMSVTLQQSGELERHCKNYGSVLNGT
jgi:hypothetical protein